MAGVRILKSTIIGAMISVRMWRINIIREEHPVATATEKYIAYPIDNRFGKPKPVEDCLKLPFERLLADIHPAAVTFVESAMVVDVAAFFDLSGHGRTTVSAF